MGNQSAFLNHASELSFVSDFNNQIIEKGTLNHPYLGKINLWEIANSNRKKIFSKNYHITKQNNQLTSIHLQRCSLKHPNLLNYYACIKKTEKLLQQVETYEFYFEYIPFTLNQFIKEGRMQEVQIWMIIEQVTDFMAYLQSLNRYHGNLTSEAIFLGENYKIKLLDQIMQNNLKLNKIKEDVYDFGLLIIEMMTQRVSWLNFSNCLKGLIGQYSLQLLQFTGRLLKQEIDQRPDFFEIQNMIKNRFITPITLKEFTQVENISHVQQNVQIISSEQLAQYQIIQQQNQVTQKNTTVQINNVQQLQSQLIKPQPNHQRKFSQQNLYMKTLPDQSLNKTNVLQKDISLQQPLDSKHQNQQQASNTERNQEPKILLKQVKFGPKHSLDQITQSYLFNQQYSAKRKAETQQIQNQTNKSISLIQTQNTLQETQIMFHNQETNPQYSSPAQTQKNNMTIQQIKSRLVINSPEQAKLQANPSINSEVSTIPTLQSESIVQQHKFQNLQYSLNQKSSIMSQYQDVKTRSFQKNQYQ